MYLIIWWLPLVVKVSSVGQTCSLRQILQNSDGACLKSNLCRLFLLRKSASLFFCVKIHWEGRRVRFLLMAWRHNTWLSLHKEREWVPPIFLFKAMIIMLSMWSCTTSLGLAYCNKLYQAALSSSQLICFPTSCSARVHWKWRPWSVWAPPACMLVLDQIWSVGLGGRHGLILLALKPPEAHHSSSLTTQGGEM